MEPSPIVVERIPKRDSHEYHVSYVPWPTSRVFWFSTTELKHLALGALLVLGVGMSFLPQFLRQLPAQMMQGALVILALVFASSFFLHEIAHKFSAQRYGLWAEFRLTLMGALITLLSALTPLFKIIAPGAVVISGPMSRRTSGKTAIAGPLTNIALSIFFVIFMMFPMNLILWTAAVLSAWINAFIALFNLIPFGMFDGEKVFRWSKAAWGIAVLTSLGLVIFIFPFVT